MMLPTAAASGPRRRGLSQDGAIAPLRGASVLLGACALMLVAGFFLGTLRAGQQQQEQLHHHDSSWEKLSEAVFGSVLQRAPGAAIAAQQQTQRQPQPEERPSAEALGVPEFLTLAAPARGCDDSCYKAKDGECDDGSMAGALQRRVYCDLGTDCSDCGGADTSTAKAAAPRGNWKDGGPVAHLRSKHVDLYTRRTTTTPSFQMLYTDPEKDLDVSEMIFRTGALEGGITAVFSQVLKGGCVDPSTGKPRLVLDVGANFGYFTVLAAKFGCRVIAWEPVPHFRAVLEYAVAANNVSHLVTVRGRVVTNKDGDLITIQVPTKGVWGTASISGISQFSTQAPAPFTVLSERIDSVVDEDVVLMKVDVEGFESAVFQSAEQLLSRRTVQHVVLEYNAGVAELAALRHAGYLDLLEANPRMMLGLLNKKFKCGMMHDHIAKGGFFPDGRFPALPEVVASRLRYDIEDVPMMRRLLPLALDRGYVADEGFTCPVKPELQSLNPEWATCTRAPDDLHPKSFRSSFQYNTNVWCAKDGKLIKFDGLAGAMGPEQSASREWIIKVKESEPFAIGAKSCAYLPAHQLVRARCSCEWAVKRGLTAEAIAVCKTEERMVKRLFRQKRFNFTDYEYQPLR